jgi:hypothetical protein
MFRDQLKSFEKDFLKKRRKLRRRGCVLKARLETKKEKLSRLQKRN